MDCGGTKLRISWHHFKASWVLSKKGWMYNHFFGEAVEPEDVEVVGNIFDNPKCFAQELKHRTGKNSLTGNELKDIIKTVKELYPTLPWR